MVLHLILISFFLAPIKVAFARPVVSISGTVEPAFYSTGDYRSYLNSFSTQLWINPYVGVSGSIGKFECTQDHISWYNSVQVDILGFETLIQSKEWNRQRLQIGLGISRQHKRADETFLEIATRDSTIIQKFHSGYMNTASNDSIEFLGDYRMRTAIRDENGFYRVGISQVRDYSLYGISADLAYSIRLYRDIWVVLSPKVKYYNSEPLYIWSMGCGLNLPLFP